jgi:hypothetical protein
MSHKLTFAGLAADIARTSFALPEADWNEPKPVERAQLETPRTGRATWGPRDAVEYWPRWTSDHHPWAAIGASGEPNGIRYANNEVDED